MDDMFKAVYVARRHASATWGYNSTQLKDVHLHKYDLALDLYGSFLPEEYKNSFSDLLEVLQDEVEDVFCSKLPNFLSATPLGQLTVIRGDNCLPTCYQY